MRTSPGWTALALFLLWTLGVALTVAGFYTFIIPDYRDATFYVVLVFQSFAELVLVGYAAYLMTVPPAVTRPSLPTRQRIMSFVALWFVVVTVMGCIAVRPSMADTFYGDKVLFFLLLLTSGLAVAAYLSQRQDVLVQVRADEPWRERVQLRTHAEAVTSAINAVHRAIERLPELRQQMSGLLKRLNTLKTQFLAASPQAVRSNERRAESAGTDRIEEMLPQLRSTCQELEAAEGQAAEAAVRELRAVADQLIDALRARETTLRI